MVGHPKVKIPLVIILIIDIVVFAVDFIFYTRTFNRNIGEFITGSKDIYNEIINIFLQFSYFNLKFTHLI